MLQNLQQAARALARRPGFTLAVVLTLAIGIGANVAIFSLIDAAFLRRMPYPDADRLVSVWSTVQRETIERRAFSYPDYLDMAAQTSALEAVAAYDTTFLNLRTRERAERVQGAVVSAKYFRTLGIQPAVGRVPTPPPPPLTEAGEEAAAGTTPTAAATSDSREATLSQALALRLFGSAEAALGETLDLDGDVFTVVGVMPAGFRGIFGRSQLWVPIESVGRRLLENRGSRWHAVVARLAPGATLEGAAEELHTIFARLEAEYPRNNQGYNADLGSLRDELYGDLRVPLLVLLSAVGLLLLIACANVANLLLVRAVGRQRETALCVALGANRGQLLRQVLSETLLLSGVGAVGGVLLAHLGLSSMLSLAPMDLVDYTEVGVDARILVFTTALALVTALALGVLVALSAHRGSPVAALRESAGSPHRIRIRKALLVTEVAMAALLVVGAALLLQTLVQLQRVDLGFDSESLAFLRVDLPLAADLPAPTTAGDDEEAREARAEERRALRASVLETVAQTPGVALASLSSDTPLAGGYSATVISREGDVPQEDAPYGGGVRVYRHLVGPGYFSTLGQTLLRGRDFDAGDWGDSLPVAIISRKLADRHFPGADALGQRFKFGRPVEPGSEDAAEAEWVSVIGVVADARLRSLVPDAEAPPEDPDVYFSLEQFNFGSVAATVRSDLDPASLLPTLQRRLEQSNAGFVVYGLETIADRVRDQTSRSRFSGVLMALFAATSLLLAAVGLYGVMGYQVAERRTEIGIRAALGARPGALVRAVVGEGLALVAVGLAAGLVAGLLAAMRLDRWLSTLLYGVEVTDPGIFALAAASLLAVGLISCWLPARRASTVDPVSALRAE